MPLQLCGLPVSILLMLLVTFTILCSILCEIFSLSEFHGDNQEVYWGRIQMQYNTITFNSPPKEEILVSYNIKVKLYIVKVNITFVS